MGGAIGALLRYIVAQCCTGIRLLTLPVGTLAVNLAGCLLLGLLTGLGESHTNIPRHILLMLTVGVCGSFTTFSTFSAETIKALEAGHIWQSALYVATSVTIGFLLFWGGKALALQH